MAGPGIAGMLIQGAQAGAQQAGAEFTGGLKQGAELASQIQDMQLKRAQLEQKKQEAQQAKFAKVGDWFETASKMPDGAAKKAFVNEFIPQGISALGLEKQINPTVMKMFTGDPNLAAFMKTKIEKGEVGLDVLTDPEKIAPFAADAKQFGDLSTFQNTVSGNLEELKKAQQFATEEQGKNQRATEAAQAQLGKQIQGQQATPEVERRKKLADLNANYEAAGGASGVKKQRDALIEVRNQLQKNEIVFGTLGKQIPYGSDEDVLARLDPAAKAAVDKVRSAVNVRASLGDPNPTERQINTLMTRSIDPRLSNKQNIEKLNAAINDFDTEIKNKEAAFKSAGFKSQIPDTSTGTFDVGGVKMNADQAKKFYESHPQFKPDPKTKKALGL